MLYQRGSHDSPALHFPSWIIVWEREFPGQKYIRTKLRKAGNRQRGHNRPGQAVDGHRLAVAARQPRRQIKLHLVHQARCERLPEHAVRRPRSARWSPAAAQFAQARFQQGLAAEDQRALPPFVGEKVGVRRQVAAPREHDPPGLPRGVSPVRRRAPSAGDCPRAGCPRR